MDRTQKVITILTIIQIVILFGMSLIAILTEDGGSSYSTTSIRGEIVEIYGGQGIYRYDTTEKAIMLRAFDWYYLVVGIPILIIGLVLFLRRSFIGYFILLSSLFFLIYSFFISSIGFAYNDFFLAYMAIYVMSTFAVIFMIKDISLEHIRLEIIPKLSIKIISIFVMFLASYFILSWLIIDFTALFSGTIHPDLDIYTTADLNIADISIYATTSITAGILLLKRKPLGAIISIGIILMAFQVLTALSIFTFLKVRFHHKSILYIEFPLVLFAIVCLIVSIVVTTKLKGIQYKLVATKDIR